MLSPGLKLRAARERLGLTFRDVEAASQEIARRHGSEEFIVNCSRLSDIETKGVLPTIYRVYALSAICRTDFLELLTWYGISLEDSSRDMAVARPPKTHRAELCAQEKNVKIPVLLDPQFDLRRTTDIGRVIEKWGVVPMAFLAEMAEDDFTYGYVGSEDFTMYPLIMPGAFIRVDERKNRVTEGSWRSEYERPIYFIESREGFVCCWCSMTGPNIILQPHPLSPVVPRTMKCPQEAEVIGQIVGVAMALDWSSESFLEPKPCPSPRLA